METLPRECACIVATSSNWQPINTVLLFFSKRSSFGDCDFHLLFPAWWCLKHSDVAIRKHFAHQFIFLLLMVKHGRNDIWSLCGHWADGRKMERGGDTWWRTSIVKQNPTLLLWAGVATGHSRLGSCSLNAFDAFVHSLKNWPPERKLRAVSTDFYFNLDSKNISSWAWRLT